MSKRIVDPLLPSQGAVLRPPGAPPISATPPSAKPSQTALGAAADALNAALQRAEKKLRDLGYGVRASVEIETYIRIDEPGADCVLCLTFGKRDGKWQLFLETYEGPEPEESDLLSASIDTRRKAAGMIPELILALESEKTQQVNALAEAESTLTKLLDELDEEGMTFGPGYVTKSFLSKKKKKKEG